ncbi:MAG TPA: TonB-dependent receptor plug domain-containing protein [Opitutaceae bacterium]|nr:TonB-dependent receptor plug domain-containing protein [Opitutaceae bacterium]
MAASSATSEEVVKLSPFEVKATAEENSYTTTATLAGNRLNTEMRDIGNAVTVITNQFMRDIGATDNQTLLQYTTNTEVGNVLGNFVGGGNGSVVDESVHFTNPNQNTRIRGLTSADNTRDYFLSDIPWEGYNIDGVDLQRGPNSILFGQGSPAGIINSRTKAASFRDSNEVSFRVGSWGSTRTAVDFNKVILKDELAIRVDAVRNDQEYKQDPAYSLDKRIYGAVRWEPAFMKKGSARTIIKANMEFGDISSNNPRQLPPIDAITPWFYTGTYQGKDVAGNTFTFNNLNRQTFTPAQNEDDNTGLPNHGQNRPSHNGPAEIQGTPNQYYQPWIGQSLGAQFGNPAWNFDWNNPAQGTGIDWEPQGFHAMSPNGVNNARTNTIAGTPFQRPAGIATYATFATNAHLPYSASGVYRDKSLTDPSVFDFYNKLLDGPNKWEWQNFRTYNISLDQTFLDDHVGFEITYNNEWYKNGKVSLLAGEQQAIGIDMNSVYSDGTPTGRNGQTRADGTPNPNLGRPFISDNYQNGNNSYQSNREAGRLIVFGDYDFNEKKSGWLARVLGRHVITGMLNSDRQNTDNRAWQRYGVDNAWEYLKNSSPTDSPRLAFTNNYTTPYTYIYLGPSLMNASSAAGANIPNPTARITLTSGSVRTFDATWNKPTNPSDPNYVDPAAYWHNDYYPLLNPITGAPMTQGDSTQSENPANYVGFRNVPITLTDSEASPANRDFLTRDARLTKSQVSTKAFTWQGHFWDNVFVATAGLRKDTAKSWQFSENTSSASSLVSNYSHLNLDSSNYRLRDNPDNTLTVKSRAWSLMAHLTKLPYFKWVPFQVSIYYNHSSDFQPAAQRVDVYGLPLAAPSGKTKDVGIWLETNDGRLSLKVNKYETRSVNASSSALNFSWFIGSSQAWAANWVNRFEFNWTSDTVGGAVAVPDPNNNEYNYSPAPGESLADAQAREASVIHAWRAWQAQVDPRFYAAWGINLNDHSRSVTASTPNGFAVTEDSNSEGYEVELNASVTRNWRVSLNGSKATAQRTNIGGTNLRAFVNAYNAQLNSGQGGVGDLRIWWGGAGNETTLQEWYSGNQPFGSNWIQRALQEGTNVPELREWRWNAITNYDFDHGWIKGVNVGAGVRYESSIVIGYKPIGVDLPGVSTYDLANPYKGPSETNFDIWIGYKRPIWRKVMWNVQLNIRNVGVGNELIPITTEPDGTGAAYRIRPPQVVYLTNTFNF